MTPGLEGAGTVTAVGPGVTEVAVGDRVCYTGVPGSYAQLNVVPADRLVKIPDGLGVRDGAAAMLQGMTAHYLAVDTYPLEKGDHCLVHAAAGGVGLLLCQIAKLRGATVIGTVSTDEKARLARGAGADHTILYTQQDFVAEVKRFTEGRGVDVVYDSVGVDDLRQEARLPPAPRRHGPLRRVERTGPAAGPPGAQRQRFAVHHPAESQPSHHLA